MIRLYQDNQQQTYNIIKKKNKYDTMHTMEFDAIQFNIIKNGTKQRKTNQYRTMRCNSSATHCTMLHGLHTTLE